MIPIHLSIAGFLSYREPVELDFSSFDLACIAGPNGAGKSSLLDAITWALFGQARKRDDSLIHSRSSQAEVGLIFSYEGNTYHVHRIKPREKTMALEFQILQPDQTWKPLTEHSLRETEAKIQRTLRMDYETFTNASFFLQGKADQFTQQRPGDRKRILSSILGLEVWEGYRQQAGERRRSVEAAIAGVDGQMREINAELAEEPARLSRLKELESDLKRQEGQRQVQEKLVQAARQQAAHLHEQARLVDAFARQLQVSELRLEQTTARLEGRRQEQQTYQTVIGRAEEIEKDHAAWQAVKAELAQVEQAAEQFRQFEQQRQEPRLHIQAEKARLEQELKGLLTEKEAVEGGLSQAEALQAQLQAIRVDLSQAEERLEQSARLEALRLEIRQQQADLRAQNASLKPEMDQLKDRIKRLELSDEGGDQEHCPAECPLCGQPLAAQERQALIERLNTQGSEMGDRYRDNKARLSQIDAELIRLETEITQLNLAKNELRQHTARIAQLEQQIETHTRRSAEWQIQTAPRLAELQQSLEEENYALEARRQLAEVDAELKAIGYDAAAHDRLRQAEQAGQASEAALNELERARAALAPLDREIADLQDQRDQTQVETERIRQDYAKAAQALADAQALAPDLDEAESRLLDFQEQENRLRMEVGSARQRVQVLDGLKQRRSALESEREANAHQVQLYKQLERAFGKDGVPALLIEQALPEIESRANQTLERLSGGGMSVQFVTQAKYKEKGREDLKETLDIQISDEAGRRDYEMFSGGEAFRVNFAIRLALSEVLAQRAGARLQTLVIDEGFGSQDAQGRQRLIEAINLVRSDFAKILVITHIDELKEAFPSRIEVQKTELGSSVRVV